MRFQRDDSGLSSNDGDLSMPRRPECLRLTTTALILTAGFIGSTSKLLAADGPQQFLKKPDDWFAGTEAKKLAENILSHQSDIGGWPKNIDTTAARYDGERSKLAPTFDNGATTGELRFLARMVRATSDARYRDAFDKGLTYILEAQYANGGWPQYFPPPRNSYHRHITFNDNAMTRLLEFLKDCQVSDPFAFVTDERKRRAGEAFDRGIQCILKCQVRANGKLTVWCAQHDEIDFRPQPARSFELASLSGSESVGIVRLLMSVERPSAEVVAAVEAAVVWFESARIEGFRVVQEDDARSPSGKNKVVVKDPAAPSLWARFYEIETNRPFFADRDGVAKYDLSEIGYERRNGYAWYGNWPQKLLDREYAAWKKAR
jgi:PelA/Pel-15E family pectate lyase